MEIIELGAELHDVGKIGVREEVLGKPGKLSREERGFPDGLKGDRILLHARVVATGDAFDAMTTARPYRPGMKAADAVAELMANRGTQFDSDVVEGFLKAHPDVTRLPIATPATVRRRLPEGMARGDVPVLIG